MPLTKIQSLGITDGTIVNADINASAAIAGTKISGSFGKVLQVVTSVFSSTASTTSTSYVTTGHSVTITPASTSNKIYLSVQGGSSWNNNDVNYNRYFTIYRASTNLSTDGNGFENQYDNSLHAGPHSMSYLDSPNTTSATTYTVYYKTQGGTSWYTHNGGSGSGTNVVLTAFEIAG
jgi:hypothetical protein